VRLDGVAQGITALTARTGGHPLEGELEGIDPKDARQLLLLGKRNGEAMLEAVERTRKAVCGREARMGESACRGWRARTGRVSASQAVRAGQPRRELAAVHRDAARLALGAKPWLGGAARLAR
jgi:hypothetical protein